MRIYVALAAFSFLSLTVVGCNNVNVHTSGIRQLQQTPWYPSAIGVGVPVSGNSVLSSGYSVSFASQPIGGAYSTSGGYKVILGSVQAPGSAQSVSYSK